MNARFPSVAADGRVPLRVRVTAAVAEALYDEASHRRQSASILIDGLLADELPRLAFERVARHVGGTRPTGIEQENAPGSSELRGADDPLSTPHVEPEETARRRDRNTTSDAGT